MELSFPNVALKKTHSELLVPLPVFESLECHTGVRNGTSESGSEVPGISKLPFTDAGEDCSLWGLNGSKGRSRVGLDRERFRRGGETYVT